VEPVKRLTHQDAAGLVRRILPEPAHQTLPNWIGGGWVMPEDGATFDTIDPSTAEPLYRVATGGKPEVDRAVEAASSASEAWWAMDGQDRARIVRRIADVVREHREPLGLLDTLDAGRPIRDTQTRDVERAARLFEFWAGATDRIRGSNVPVQPGYFNFTDLEPYGVVGAITPWNYPLTNAATKVAPAIACGNGVVLKPAEATPLSATFLAYLAHQAGLPAGLFNVVNGRGSRTGQAIVDHPGVGKITFTGSTEVGRLIGRACGESLKSVTLELGGKTPNLVFADADHERAADAAVFTAFMNQGQTCTAGTRLLVDDSIAERFVSSLQQRLDKLKVGDPLDPNTQIGPIITAEQLARVQEYLHLGEEEGARPVCAARVSPDVPAGGYFVAPTIFGDVRPTMRIAREEIFGSVLSLFTFSGEEEAVELANDTPYGLAATLWTSDLSRAHRLAKRLKAGIIWINTVHALHPGSPYGGQKQSGLGLEMGLEAIYQLMRVKSVWVGVEGWKSPWS
jgi:acyl-CoA reductase-like NAD-dependent aldehyde dehydrogenase